MLPSSDHVRHLSNCTCDECRPTPQKAPASRESKWSAITGLLQWRVVLPGTGTVASFVRREDAVEWRDRVYPDGRTGLAGYNCMILHSSETVSAQGVTTIESQRSLDLASDAISPFIGEDGLLRRLAMLEVWTAVARAIDKGILRFCMEKMIDPATGQSINALPAATDALRQGKGGGADA